MLASVASCAENVVVAAQACARCCLRFVGESGEIYAASAPACGDLKAAVPATDGNAQASKLPATGRPEGDNHDPGLEPTDTVMQ